MISIRIKLPTSIETMTKNVGEIAARYNLNQMNIYMHVDDEILQIVDPTDNEEDRTLNIVSNVDRNCWHKTFMVTFHSDNCSSNVFVLIFSNLPHFDHEHKLAKCNSISTQFTTFSTDTYEIQCTTIPIMRDMYDNQFKKSSQYTKEKKITMMTDYVNETYGSDYDKVVLFLVDDDLYKHTRTKGYIVNKLSSIFNIEEKKKSSTSQRQKNLVVHFLDIYTATISLYGNYLQSQEVTFASETDFKTEGLQYPTVHVHDPSIVQTFPDVPIHELIRRFVKYRYFESSRGAIVDEIRQIVYLLKPDKKNMQTWKEIR